jgi:GT2 family glycosyltransferase
LNVPSPLVSVILVTWNSAANLPHCLFALAAQTAKDFEVVIMDNGSTDDGLSDLDGKYPELDLSIKKLGSNLGFATANNLAARLARGRWLALLNSDAFPEPDWLEQLLRATESNPEFSFFASRQIQANASNLLDGSGDDYHVSGLSWRRYAGFPAAQFGLQSEEVFSPCAAAALYSREAILQVGGFDEDFFSYLEDVDLGFRLRLEGHRCLYVPEAVVYHIGSATLGVKSDFALYHFHRNLIWLFVQNMPSSRFWVFLPAHLLANLIYPIYHTLRGHGRVLWQAKLDALRGLPRALHKRRKIQSGHKYSPADLERVMQKGLFQPYILGIRRKKALKGMEP